MQLKPSAVRTRAEQLGLRVMAPQRIDAPFIAEMAELRPQLIAVVSYGKILPAALLDTATAGALNVHPSLLPEYRGAAPIQWALRDGRTQTGVTIIWMSPEMDAGDIALQRDVAIAPGENFGALHDRLAALGAQLLAAAARQLAEHRLPRVPQDHTRATFTKMLTTGDLLLKPDMTAKQNVDLVRSASPRPGAWTMFDGRRLKVIEARAEPPGSPLVTDDGPSVPASDGVVRLLRVIPEGRREMAGAEFARNKR